MDLPVQPKKFIPMDSDFGTSVSKALWRQAAQMLEYVNQSYPLGMLMFFNASQTNLPAQPDPRFWKFMDGSVISNANSPMNGQTVPDLRGVFVRPPQAGVELALTFVGTDTRDFSHAHTGNTGSINPVLYQDVQCDSFDYAFPQNHKHSIATQSLIVSVVPLSYEVQVYMRVA